VKDNPLQLAQAILCVHVPDRDNRLSLPVCRDCSGVLVAYGGPPVKWPCDAARLAAAVIVASGMPE
jgi:hypothetical protein